MGSSRPRNSSRRKAHPRILKPRREPVPLKLSKPLAARDAVRSVTLRQIHGNLERICSTALVVAHALRQQNVELDGDAASVLRWHVSDPLFEQVMRIDRLLKGGAL